MKAVAYVRSSTDKQAASPERQRSAIRDYAARKGYTITAWFEDVGVSGDDDDRRVGFLQLLDAADRREIDRVIVFDRARFGRGDSIQMAKWTGRLRKASVRLETAVDGKVVDWGTMIGRITDAIDAEMSAEYQRTLAKNTVSGKLQKLRDVTTNGLLGQPPTYGRLREIVRVDGSRIVATSVVDPAHGPIVEQMFRLYCQPGWSVRKIALHLNRENIPSMRGGVWSCSAVRGVLENPLHAGDYRYGVLRRGKHAAMGPAGTILDRDRDDKVARGEPVIIRNAVEPTVPRALFDQVQRLLRERARQTVPENKVRVLSGVVACGSCGQTMRVVGNHFRCCGDPRLGKPCKGHVVREDAITNMVIDGLRGFLAPSQLARLEQRLSKKASANSSPARPHGPRKGTAQRELARLEREISAGVKKLPMMPVRAAIELGKHIDRLTAQRDAIASTVLAVAPSTSHTPADHKARVKQAMSLLHTLHKVLTGKSIAASNESLRRLGARVFLEVSPSKKAVRVTFGNPARRGGSRPREHEGLRLSERCPRSPTPARRPPAPRAQRRGSGSRS